MECLEGKVVNSRREKIKMRVFLALYIIFAILTFIGGFMVITERLDDAGYAVIPMLFGLIFSVLYRNSKKAIEENKQ